MILINNLTTVPVDEKFVKKIVKIVLKGEKKEKGEISIAFVGSERIRELNRKYRGRNKTTDILSFGGDGSGELVICLKQVKKNSKIFKSTFNRELARVLTHGTLHLLGYEHEKSERDKDKMMAKEEYYLSFL
jgi:probable rRNA maturation factor